MSSGSEDDHEEPWDGATEEDPGADPVNPRIKARVDRPALFLLASGIANVVFAIFMVANTIHGISRTPDELEAQQEILLESFRKFGLGDAEIAAQRKSGASLRQQGLFVNGFLTLAALLGAVIPVQAAQRMRALQSHTFCIFGAIIVAIPCISASGCCLYGIGVGIWALVVLTNPAVKAAFR